MMRAVYLVGSGAVADGGVAPPLVYSMRTREGVVGKMAGLVLGHAAGDAAGQLGEREPVEGGALGEPGEALLTEPLTAGVDRVQDSVGDQDDAVPGSRVCSTTRSETRP
jgi:hypothetical protein